MLFSNYLRLALTFLANVVLLVLKSAVSFSVVTLIRCGRFVIYTVRLVNVELKPFRCVYSSVVGLFLVLKLLCCLWVVKALLGWQYCQIVLFLSKKSLLITSDCVGVLKNFSILYVLLEVLSYLY